MLKQAILAIFLWGCVTVLCSIIPFPQLSEGQWLFSVSISHTSKLIYPHFPGISYPLNNMLKEYIVWSCSLKCAHKLQDLALIAVLDFIVNFLPSLGWLSNWFLHTVQRAFSPFQQFLLVKETMRRVNRFIVQSFYHIPRTNCKKSFLFRIIFYKVLRTSKKKNPPKSSLGNIFFFSILYQGLGKP